jgi:hypothetical protein
MIVVEKALADMFDRCARSSAWLVPAHEKRTKTIDNFLVTA